MRLPNGVSTQTRQSPISSRVRSMTMVRSSGTAVVAISWSARKRMRFSAAMASRSCSRVRRLSAALRGMSRSSRTSWPMRRPNSSGRPALSPCQNGILPGWPGAGDTSTRSWVISSMRQVDAPRIKVSPVRLSKDHLLVQFAHADRLAFRSGREIRHRARGREWCRHSGWPAS